MKTYIDLSIIVPCYNEEKNIPLLTEKFSQIGVGNINMELILVNNGSSDNSKEIISNIMKHDSRIKTIEIRENMGYGHGIKQGLNFALGNFVCWTHADMQTDIFDTIKGYQLIMKQKDPTHCFIKGKRYNRPFFDLIFSIGMSIFESILLKKRLMDINAQPSLFSQKLLPYLKNSPNDFSFDLFVYYQMKLNNIPVYRIPVLFGDRAHGTSHWNTSIFNKYKFIKRTINYSIALKKQIIKCDS